MNELNEVDEIISSNVWATTKRIIGGILCIGAAIYGGHLLLANKPNVSIYSSEIAGHASTAANQSGGWLWIFMALVALFGIALIWECPGDIREKFNHVMTLLKNDAGANFENISPF